MISNYSDPQKAINSLDFCYLLVIFFSDWDPMGFITILHHLGKISLELFPSIQHTQLQVQYLVCPDTWRTYSAGRTGDYQLVAGEGYNDKKRVMDLTPKLNTLKTRKIFCFPRKWLEIWGRNPQNGLI